MLYFAVYCMFQSTQKLWYTALKICIPVSILKLYIRLLPFRVFRGPSGFKVASLTLVKLS